MRRIIIAIGTTLTGLTLLFSWPTSLNRTVATTDTAAGTDATSSADSAAAAAHAAADEAQAAADAAAAKAAADSSSATAAADAAAAQAAADAAEQAATTSGTVTYDGAAASTRYGNVQVRITVTDGALTSAEAIDFPNSDRHDQQINAYAIPILNDEAVAAGSAAISMVSGATVTSRGYLTSLQSALDQAGL